MKTLNWLTRLQWILRFVMTLGVGLFAIFAFAVGILGWAFGAIWWWTVAVEIMAVTAGLVAKWLLDSLEADTGRTIYREWHPRSPVVPNYEPTYSPEERRMPWQHVSGPASDVIDWTPAKLSRFRTAYNKAIQGDAEQPFTFDGREFIPSYAYYLIEYLSTVLK